MLDSGGVTVSVQYRLWYDCFSTDPLNTGDMRVILTRQKSGVVKTVVSGPAPLVNVIESVSEVVILIRLDVSLILRLRDSSTKLHRVG